MQCSAIMSRALFAVALLFAASCANPAGVQDGVLTGFWRSSTASVSASPGRMGILDDAGWGETDGPVDPGYGGEIQEYGVWAQSAAAGGRYRRVRYTGTLDLHTGWLQVVASDSASGERFFAEWLKPAAPPPPPYTPPTPP